LQQLLADGLAGELKLGGETGDRGRSLPLQSEKDRAPAVRQLVDGNDGGFSLLADPETTILTSIFAAGAVLSMNSL
jgi:hypothetical protein